MAPDSDFSIPDSHSEKPAPARPFSRWYFKLLLFLALIAALLFGLSGYLYRWDVLELGAAFTLLRYASYAAMGLGVLALGSLFFAARSRFKARHLIFCMMALLLSGGVSGVALYWNYQAQNKPFLHDVTTDTIYPPRFDVIAGLRADAPNPPEYPGDEAAELQREGYPDIITTFFVHQRQTVFYQALALVEARGWNLARADADDYIIEATEVLPWFGFKDDVVIRLEPDGKRTIFDMRSKSRVGGTDLGVNAARIRSFIEDLRMRLRDEPLQRETAPAEPSSPEEAPAEEPDEEAGRPGAESDSSGAAAPDSLPDKKNAPPPETSPPAEEAVPDSSSAAPPNKNDARKLR